MDLKIYQQCKTRVLFVDDEQPILNALRRNLHAHRNQLQLHFCQSGQQALELMAEHTMDVIITDMQMPNMDGAELLNEVKQHYPNTIRIMLSGNANTDSILRNVQSIHILLSKPISTVIIMATINRAIKSRDQLSEPALIELISGIGTLPSLPSLYSQITAHMNSESGSLVAIGKLIEKDIAITSKVLQLVNSPYFGVQQPIHSAAKAVSLLGFDIVCNLVLASELFESFRQKGVALVTMESLWQQANTVSELAASIASHEGLPERECHLALTAGLLHNIGKLVLRLHYPDCYHQVERLVATGQSEDVAEKTVFGVYHGAVGAYVLSLWGLPTELVGSLLIEDEDQLDLSNITPANTVFIANLLVKEQQGVEQNWPITGDQDDPFIHKLSEWRDLIVDSPRKI